MGEVLNLRRARKAKRRAEADRQGEANRALHGRSAAERTQTLMELERADQRLDHHRRD